MLLDRDLGILDILSKNGYRYDCSKVKGSTFLLLKLTHWIINRKLTNIYGSFNEILSRDTSINFSHKNIACYSIECIYNIPFYNSCFKFLRNSLKELLIIEANKRDFNSFTFHAVDFVQQNKNITRETLSIINKYFTICSVRHYSANL